MRADAHELDLLVARLARVDDRRLGKESESGSEAATALFEQIVSVPVAAPRTTPRGGSRRPAALVAFAAALALALTVSLPALGIGQKVVSFFAGWHDPDAPVPTASDVVIASGEAGVRWKIVATSSARGLCLGFLSQHPVEGWGGSGGCGPTDVRGDPWAPDARHWIESFGVGGGAGGLNRTFAWGRLAEDVRSLELELTDGTTVRANIVEGPESLEAPIDYYWAAWPCGSPGCLEEIGTEVEMAIARDDEGRVLERRLPAWNGNPTGDPDGPPPPLG
jgi:hypothetical protein